MEAQPRPLIVEPFLSKKDDKWRVRIVAANGEKVMTSEAYGNKSAATRSARRIAGCGATGFELRLAQ